MLIMFTDHHRSGTVRRSLEIYTDFQLAEMDAIARMQANSSIDEIDIQRITSLNFSENILTITRAQSERSMFDETTDD